jgi:hypothetical protein
MTTTANLVEVTTPTILRRIRTDSHLTPRCPAAALLDDTV